MKHSCYHIFANVQLFNICDILIPQLTVNERTTIMATLTVTKRDLRKFYNQVRKGRSKFEIERTELGLDTHRGKYLTRLFESAGLTA